MVPIQHYPINAAIFNLLVIILPSSIMVASSQAFKHSQTHSCNLEPSVVPVYISVIHHRSLLALFYTRQRKMSLICYCLIWKKTF